MTRRFFAIALAAAILSPTFSHSAVADSAANKASADFVEITPELKRSIEKGLKFLATQQQPDGSFGADRYGKHVGITAVACLAFMSHGDLPDRGDYGPYVKKGLKFILDNAQENGLVAADVSHGPMYGHGFATLFLAEVYGQTGDKRTHEALVKAIRLIRDSQNKEGGWRYQPVSNDADISVTICQVMALRAARNAGVKVEKEIIDKAVEYVRKCQNGDGGFRYMANSGSSAFPRSAAGVATLYYAGIYEDKSIDRGLAYLSRHLPGRGGSQSHYFYGHYYAAQTMFMAGGDHWKKWFTALRAELLAKQNPQDGHWDGQAGDAYGTSMALICLQMPHRYLPIFQK
ncbi:MAG: terpene cyclase/mutase family protein [Proteobacteria bacterium]|nr:terpene cyclase/mutase family protein [Pseudomonadota bacterium]